MRNDPPNDCWIENIGYDKPCCDTKKSEPKESIHNKPEYVGCFYDNHAYGSSGCPDDSYKTTSLNFDECHDQAINAGKKFFTFQDGNTCRACNGFSI
jgi:hypothetical protein